jgi:hypothetical protein
MLPQIVESSRHITPGPFMNLKQNLMSPMSHRSNKNSTHQGQGSIADSKTRFLKKTADIDELFKMMSLEQKDELLSKIHK